MAKPNPLAAGLNQLARRAAPAAAPPVDVLEAEPAQAPRAAGKRKPSREGRVLVGGFFSPEVHTALKVIAAQERTTVQALLTEGLNSIFARRGQPEIAGLPPKQD